MTRTTTCKLLLAVAVGTVAGLVAARPRVAERSPARARRAPRRVVVIGAGFGGLAAAARLAGRPGIDLTVIDRQNHHLFQPLLYQVATAALSPAEIASPVRAILDASPYLHVQMACVTGIDIARQHVLCESGPIPYDELIVATGSETSYFGHAAWAEVATGLKTLDDALHLRQRILGAFERAVYASPADRAPLLTFVLIGGGPTGVEMAGSIAELARDMLARDFDLPGAASRIVLIEAGPRILAEFAPSLSAYAEDTLRRLGVEVMTGARVTEIVPGSVQVGDTAIGCATVVWAAGTEATPVAGWLGVAPAKGGRIAVGPDLRLPGHPEIAVIGDAALAAGADGKPLPGLAPVAKQQGSFVARAILRQLRGRPAAHPFAYRDYGALATIGRNEAVAEFGPVHITGPIAWAAWAAVHIVFLIGFRNRVMVSLQWLFAYLTRERAGRLIIGRETQPPSGPEG